MRFHLGGPLPQGVKLSAIVRWCIEQAKPLLVRLEVQDQLGGSADDGIQVLWRHAPDKGRKVHLICRRADGTFIAQTKVGRRWTRIEGDLDSVVATIPDALFAHAAEAVATYRR